MASQLGYVQAETLVTTGSLQSHKRKRELSLCCLNKLFDTAEQVAALLVLSTEMKIYCHTASVLFYLCSLRNVFKLFYSQLKAFHVCCFKLCRIKQKPHLNPLGKLHFEYLHCILKTVNIFVESLCRATKQYVMWVKKSSSLTSYIIEMFIMFAFISYRLTFKIKCNTI